MTRLGFLINRFARSWVALPACTVYRLWRFKRRKYLTSLFLLVILLVSFLSVVIVRSGFAQPAWPQSWIQIDWDRNEDGSGDDWRDVEYAYYQYDGSYLYLKLQCYGLPGGEWPSGDGRYKWFIDFEGNMYISGGNVYDAECLLFVEDTDHNGVGEMYLLSDTDNSNNFAEYEPWPPANYANYKVADSNIGEFRIVATNAIEMYIRWSSIGNPPSYSLLWATDQQNPNLDQSPSTDQVDEAQPIVVRNVAAISQTPTPTVVKQGEHVSIDVVTENKGTHIETFNVTCYFSNTIIGTELVSNLAAGQKATLTFDWDTSGVPLGSYEIKAWADSSAAITETDETDNWCTAPATVTIESAPVHDVAAVSQVPDKTSVIQGTIVNINVTVLNFGDFAETFNVTGFYNSNPIGYQTVSLAPKTSTYRIFAWDTTGVAPNTYYIHAMADSGRVIDEINEDNNNCTSFQTVTIYSTDIGKLFVDKVKTAVISGSDPPVVGYPTVYEFTIVVTNIGGNDVSNIKVNETISSEVTFLSVGTPSQGSIVALPPPKIVWDVGTLIRGAGATLTFRVTAVPASYGLVHLNHKEDIVASGRDILGNPVSASGITDTDVTAILRDVAAVNQVPSQTVVPQGNTIAVEVAVENFGNVSETFDVEAYYDSNPIGVARVYNLDGGSQVTLCFAWDTIGTPPGTYSIKAEADSSSEIAESNETNNVCTSPATVRIVIHDIAITSQAPSPTSVVQGEPVTITVVVKNEGTEPEDFTVGYYINETLLETKTVTNLQPNTTMTLHFLWDTTSFSPGIYFVNTGASTVPDEKDTNDNACLSTTSVRVRLPQFQVTFQQTGLDSTASSTVVTVNGVPKTFSQLPYSFPADAGTIITYTYSNVSSVTTGKRFNLTSITGPVSPIMVTSSVTITGNYKTQYYLTVTSDYDTPNPVSGWFDSGASITASVTSPASGPIGTRYVCTGWTGSGSVPASGTTSTTTFTIMQASSITWNWKAQYLLTVRTDPASLSPQPTRNPTGETGTTDSWWYDATTNVTLTAQEIFGYTFNYWDVDTTSKGTGVNPITVKMNAPHTATAHYTLIPPPAIPVGGHSISLAKPAPAYDVPVYAALIGLIGMALILVKRKR